MAKTIRGKEIGFRKFLETGVARGTFGDTPENDFAKDTMRDLKFKDFNDWKTLRQYLVFHKACPEALEAAENLFKKWKAAK